jgi:hypothetical protein
LNFIDARERKEDGELMNYVDFTNNFWIPKDKGLFRHAVQKRGTLLSHM